MNGYTTCSYENFRRISYDGWQFVPVCPDCGQFAKADDSILINGLGEYKRQPNATCKRCGRIEMPCEGCL